MRTLPEIIDVLKSLQDLIDDGSVAIHGYPDSSEDNDRLEVVARTRLTVRDCRILVDGSSLGTVVEEAIHQIALMLARKNATCDQVDDTEITVTIDGTPVVLSAEHIKHAKIAGLSREDCARLVAKASRAPIP